MANALNFHAFKNVLKFFTTTKNHFIKISKKTRQNIKHLFRTNV